MEHLFVQLSNDIAHHMTYSSFSSLELYDFRYEEEGTLVRLAHDLAGLFHGHRHVLQDPQSAKANGNGQEGPLVMYSTVMF